MSATAREEYVIGSIKDEYKLRQAVLRMPARRRLPMMHQNGTPQVSALKPPLRSTRPQLHNRSSRVSTRPPWYGIRKGDSEGRLPKGSLNG